MLAKGVRGCSKVLIIVLLDLADEYVTTQAEARAIADPTARMLNRIKLLKSPIKWLTGNSDELALLAALGAYGMRLIDPISVKIEVASTERSMKKQMEVDKKNGTQGPTRTSVAPTTQRNDSRTNGKAQPAGTNTFTPAYAGFAPESVEAQPTLIPGVGIGYPY